MKLVTNKPYDTLFVYFPSLSLDWDYTIDKPGLWHLMHSNNQATIRFNLSSVYKYVLFGVEANLDYVITCHGYDNWQAQYDYAIYDYGDFELDQQRNILSEPIEIGILSRDFSALVNLPYSRTLLLAIKPSYYDHTGQALLQFSQTTPAIQTSEHWERDWQQRIDGTSWDVAGKVNEAESLSGINRRTLPSVSALPVLCDGARYQTIQHLGQQISCVEDFENAFANSSIVEEGIADLPKMVGEETKIVKFDFLIYASEDRYQEYYLKTQGECAFACNNVRQFWQNDGSVRLQLRKGFNKAVLYVLQKNLPYEDAWLQVSPYAANLFNIDQRIDFAVLNQGRLLFRAGLDLQPTILSSIRISKRAQYCLSFFVKTRPYGNLTKYYIMQSNQVSIMRNGEDELLVTAGSDDGKTIKAPGMFDEKYHHIGINVSETCASVVVDGKTSAWVLCNFDRQSELVAFGGNAFVSYRCFSHYNRCLTQGELNCISNKMEHFVGL